MGHLKLFTKLHDGPGGSAQRLCIYTSLGPSSFSIILIIHVDRSLSRSLSIPRSFSLPLHTLFNMFKSLIFASLLAAGSAHQNFHQFWVNDVSPGFEVGIRMPPSNSPVVCLPILNILYYKGLGLIIPFLGNRKTSLATILFATYQEPMLQLEVLPP